MFKSITLDNGCEFLNQEALEASSLKPGQNEQYVTMHTPTAHENVGANEVANKLIQRFMFVPL